MTNLFLIKVVLLQHSQQIFYFHKALLFYHLQLALVNTTKKTLSLLIIHVLNLLLGLILQAWSCTLEFKSNMRTNHPWFRRWILVCV